YAFGTLALQYSKTFFSEPLCTLLLLLAAFSLYICRSADQLRYSFVAGMFFGLALLTKFQTIVFLPAYGTYFIFSAGQTPVEKVRKLLTFVAGIVPCIVLHLLLTFIEFNALQSPYLRIPAVNFHTPIYFGLYGLLFSSG